MERLKHLPLPPSLYGSNRTEPSVVVGVERTSLDLATNQAHYAVIVAKDGSLRHLTASFDLDMSTSDGWQAVTVDPTPGFTPRELLALHADVAQMIWDDLRWRLTEGSMLPAETPERGD